MDKTNLEELSLRSFAKSNNLVSLTTQHYSAERRGLKNGSGQKMVGESPQSTKLINTSYDKNKDWITYYFLTVATPKYGPEHQYKDTNPDKAFGLEDDPSELYEIELRFFNVSALKRIEDITAQEVKNFLWNTDFALWSNSPSFHWQGFNYKMSQLGASLFPTNIPPTVWKNVHGDALIDKHLYDLFLHITWFLNQMASALINALRSEGMMPKYKRPSRAKPKSTPPSGTTSTTPSTPPQ